MKSKFTSPTQRDLPDHQPMTNNNAKFSQKPLLPHAHILGDSCRRIASNMTPEVDGRNTTPPSSGQCKRPPYLSIDSARGSEASSVRANDQKDDSFTTHEASTKSDVTQSPPFTIPLKNDARLLAAQPPRTPQGRSAYTTFDDGGLSAAQRVRIGLSSHSGSRSQSCLRANSFEDVFATNSPTYDEKKNGPRSCPTLFRETCATRTSFSPGGRRHERNGDLIASKLLPTCDRIDNLLTYMHELQLSETSLQKQLVTTKRHTEEELNQLMSKLNELRRTMQKVEMERQTAQARLEEKEKRIRELAAKLKKVEATQNKTSSPTRKCGTSHDGLPSIAEEESVLGDNDSFTEEQSWLQTERKSGNFLIDAIALPAKSLSESPTLTTSLRPARLQLIHDESTQFAAISPRSPNRPLWDPWASGGATPMKNMPPVFTLGATELQAEATAVSTEYTLPITMNVEDDELRSVLMSPRCGSKGSTLHVEKQHKPSNLPPEQKKSAPVEPQLSAPSSNAGSLSSPLEQQPLRSIKAQCADDEQEMKNESLVKTNSSPSDSMLRVEPMPPIYQNSFEQHEDCLSAFGNDSDEAHRQKIQQNLQTQKVSFTKNGLVQAPTFLAGQSTSIPQQQGMNNKDTLKLEIPYRTCALRVEDSKAVQVSQSKSETFCARLGNLVLAASPPQKNGKTVFAEPESLEALLIDFFTKVDKKRLKMATVYGKRYTGREEWLFAELTKRYGSAKVAAMKARYENRKHASTTSNSGGSDNNDSHATKLSNASDHANVSRQSNPQHQQFLHPPISASEFKVDGAGSLFVSHSFQYDNAPNRQPLQEAEGARTQLSPSEDRFTDCVTHVSPQRRSVDNMLPLAGPSSSILTPKTIHEIKCTAGSGTNKLSMSDEPTPTQSDEPFSAPSHQFGAQASSTNLSELCQRNNASGGGIQNQKNKLLSVSLEGLLKEFYTHHQPDKLKNASIVAKQYAGKECELVRLLKRKYGSLSVKRLENSLEVLEQTYKARIGGIKAIKNRSCCIRTISLMFWLLVVLYSSFSTVFVSFVALDVWECHAFGNNQQEFESTEECARFKKDLETFRYERIADYVSQSYSSVCFCSEWNARQSALFKNLLVGNIVELVKLMPFSTNLFGRPWIASVKEHFWLQKTYDSYAKPVGDLLLSANYFMWSSFLELTGTDDKSEKKFRLAKNIMNDDAGISLLGKGIGSDESLKRVTKNVENNNEAKTGELLFDESKIAKSSSTSEETSVEDEINMNEDIYMDSVGVAATNEMSEENIPIDKQVAAIDRVNVAIPVKANEDHDPMGSVDVLELNKLSFIKKSESGNTNKVELADIKRDTTKPVIMHDAAIILSEESGYIVGDGDETFCFPQNEQARNALYKVPELAIVIIANLSLEKNSASFNYIVETEKRMKGVGLSLFETQMDASDGEGSTADHTDSLSSASLENSDPFKAVNREEFRDAEPHVIVGLDSTSTYLVMGKSESVTHSADKAIIMAGNDADVQIEEVVQDFGKKLSLSSTNFDVIEPAEITVETKDISFIESVAIESTEAVIIADTNSDDIDEYVAKQDDNVVNLKYTYTQGAKTFTLVKIEEGFASEKEANDLILASAGKATLRTNDIANVVSHTNEALLVDELMTSTYSAKSTQKNSIFNELFVTQSQSIETHDANTILTFTAEAPGTVASTESNINDESAVEFKLEAIILEHDSNIDEDTGKDEDISFMEELENPGELLRLAEQAAIAELMTMETQW